MTRKSDEWEPPLNENQYAALWKNPTTLAEQDEAWDKSDWLRELQAARVAKRGRP